MAAGVPQFASLYVGDLHPDVTEAMLYEIFNAVGQVASIRVCRDSVSRRSLGYAYVNFHNVSDAERALDTLNYSSIKGRSCRIMWSQRDPSLRKSGAGNIYVKNLDPTIDNKALYDTFSLFGNILSCKVATDANGKSQGYGFVHYESEEAAKTAIERIDNMKIGDKVVHVCQFVKRSDRVRPPITNYKNIYIKNFPADWDDAKISEAFGEFGELTSVAVMADKKGRRFAFVNFSTSEAAVAAVEGMNGKDMRTEEEKAEKKGEDEEEVGPEGPSYLLYVARFQPKAERQAELRGKFGQEDKSGGRAQGVNLYVKNLDEGTDDAALRALFEPFGNITSVAAMKDDRDKCKGFGFVCFASPDEATKAVTEMHLKVVKGKPLYVGLAEKREARQERLRQRYSPGGGGMPGGKLGGKGGPKGCKGGMPTGMPAQMYGGPQGMMGFPGMQGMMGMQGMSARPNMQGMMCPQMQMMGGPRGPMPGPGGKGGPTAPMGCMMGKGMTGPGVGGKPGMPMGNMPMPMGGMMGMMPRPPMMPMRPPAAQMQGQQMGGGMGMRPMGAPPQQMQAQQAQQGTGQPLTASALASAPPQLQKQMLGEKLYPLIAKQNPELAGKITGMMLEMDNSELLILLESEAQLKHKVNEALRVLDSAK